MRILNTLRKRIVKKLCNKSGESIAETLVALLIAALALTMLAGAITASSSIVTKSMNKLNSYYTGSKIVVTMPASFNSDVVVKGTTSITIQEDDGSISKYTISSVPYYSNNAFNKIPVIAY